MILLALLALSAAQPDMQTNLNEMKDNIADILGDLKEIQETLNYQSEVLWKTYEKEIGDMNKKVKTMGTKARKTTSTVGKTVETEIMMAFHRAMEEKGKMANDHLKYIDDKIDKKKITNRLEKIVDIYWKRQQVPDPDLQNTILALESKFGGISDTLSGTYNLDWLYIILIVLALGVLLTWKQLQTAQRKHIL